MVSDVKYGEFVVEPVVETAESLAPKVNVSSRTVQREFAALQKMGRFSREGNDSDGRWIVHPENNL